jgi:hypothetical protein
MLPYTEVKPLAGIVTQAGLEREVTRVTLASRIRRGKGLAALCGHSRIGKSFSMAALKTREAVGALQQDPGFTH